MRKRVALLVLLALVFGAATATARGGRSDDCPPGSKDPDCTDSSKSGK